MARLPRCFLLSTFIIFTLSSFAPNAHSALLPNPYPDCIGDVLKWINWSEARSPLKDALIRNADYNERLFKKFGDLPKEEWENQISKVIEDYAANDGGFYEEAFRRWLKENPGKFESDSSLFKNKKWVKENPDAYGTDTTLGGYLTKRGQRFVEKNPDVKLYGVNLKNVTEDLTAKLRAIGEECGNNQLCNEKKISALFTTKLPGLCLFKKPAAMKALVVSLATMNLGYAYSAHAKPENGYPYDLMANNLIWSPIMSELSCRNALGGTDRIGQKIDFGQPLTRIEKWRRGVNSYASYMTTSLPWTGTYLFLTMGVPIMRGKKHWSDYDLGEVSKQVVALTAWDALWAVPIRQVGLMDPLTLRTFPKYTNKYYNRQMNYVADHPDLSPMAKKVMQQKLFSRLDPVEWTIRIGVSGGNNMVFDKYKVLSNYTLGTHFPMPTPTPETPKPKNADTTAVGTDPNLIQAR